MLGIRYCADQKFAHRKFHFDDELVWSSSYVCLFVIFLLLYLKFELLLLLWWECRNKINKPTSDKTEKMSWLTQSAVALLHFLMTRWQTKSRLSRLSKDAGNYHYVSIIIIISISILIIVVIISTNSTYLIIIKTSTSWWPDGRSSPDCCWDQTKVTLSLPRAKILGRGWKSGANHSRSC